MVVTAPDVTDGDLLKQVTAGDTAAWDQLVRRHGDAVYSLSLRIVRNVGDAEDIGQETFLRVKEYAHTFDAANFGGNARGWILRIASREALKLSARRTAAPAQLHDAADAVEARSESAPLERREMLEVLRHSVDGLPDRQREAVVLHFGGGLTQVEIAKELGCDQSTVSDRIRAGLEKLRHQLERAGIGAAALAPNLIADSIVSQSAPQNFISSVLLHSSIAGASAAVAKVSLVLPMLLSSLLTAAVLTGTWALWPARTMGPPAAIAPVVPTQSPSVPANPGPWSFEDGSLQGWEVAAGCSAEVQEAHASDGQRALKVLFGTEKFPSLHLQLKAAADWRQFDALRFTLYNPHARSYNLSVRVDDTDSRNFETRYNLEDALRVRPGMNEFEVTTASMRQGTLHSRGLRLNNITQLRFFLVHPTAPATFFFDNIRLIKADRSNLPVLPLVLFDADSARWDLNFGATAVLGRQENASALRVAIQARSAYPGISFTSLPADWLGYDELQLSLSAERAGPLSLRIDGRDGRRQTIVCQLNAGDNQVRLPLEMLSQLPLGGVTRLTLFVPEPAQNQSFLLQELQLVRVTLKDGPTYHARASAADPLAFDFQHPRFAALPVRSLHVLVWVPTASGVMQVVRCMLPDRGIDGVSVPSEALLEHAAGEPLRVWAYFLDHGDWYCAERVVKLAKKQVRVIFGDPQDFGH